MSLTQTLVVEDGAGSDGPLAQRVALVRADGSGFDPGQGPAGPEGPKGEPGPGILMGYGPPSGDVEPGTTYIDLDTYDIYRADA